MTHEKLNRKKTSVLFNYFFAFSVQAAFLAFASSAQGEAAKPEIHAKMSYSLAWEAKGEESVCRNLQHVLNRISVPTGCLGVTPEVSCPFDELALGEQPGFSTPDWLRISGDEQEKVLRVLSDFRAGPGADLHPEQREWQWKNQYGPILTGAKERGTMKLLVAHFDVNNDGKAEWVRRVEVSPLDPHPFFFQAASNSELLGYDRSIWDEASDWSPFFFDDTTYWLSWSTVIGRSDQKYLTRDAINYAFVAALHGEVGRVRLNEYTYKCVYAIKEAR